MKLDTIIEMEGELLPYDESTAMQLAKDLLRGAKGDAGKAKQMAQYMIQQVIGNIDAHAKRVKMKTTTGERIS